MNRNQFFLQSERVSHYKGDRAAVERGQVYMMIKLIVLFGFIFGLEKIIYLLVFNLKLKKDLNDRVLFKITAVVEAAANDGNIKYEIICV